MFWTLKLSKPHRSLPGLYADYFFANSWRNSVSRARIEICMDIRASRSILGFGAYLAWMLSMYSTRFAIRCCTCASCPWLMLENSGPQTGISWLPWDAVIDCPRRTAATCDAGYFPPLFFARAVRSAGLVFIAEAAGPAPFASVPWQTAQ